MGSETPTHPGRDPGRGPTGAEDTGGIFDKLGPLVDVAGEERAKLCVELSRQRIAAGGPVSAQIINPQAQNDMGRGPWDINIKKKKRKKGKEKRND